MAVKKETKNTVSCDNLGCENIAEFENIYPYSEGWYYVYELNMQIPSKKAAIIKHAYETGKVTQPPIPTDRARVKAKDNHYCSAKCFLSALAAVFEAENANS